MEPFLWAKVFDFSMTTILKILSFLFKVAIVVGIPLAIGWGVYVTMIKPHTNPTPTTEQSAEVMNNAYHYYPKPTFGCVNFRIMQMKQDAVVNPPTPKVEVKKEVKKEEVKK